MYYAELSGPNGSTNVLTTNTNASGKAATAKGAEAKAADGKAAAPAPAKTESPAYTISQSMESLLDSMTGQGKKPAGASTASASGGGLDRARQAQGLMQNALDQSKGLSDMFGKAIDGMQQGLGDILGALGMPQSGVDSAKASFGDAMKSKLADMDFSKMAVDMTAARSQWSIESHGMELTIEDGDRKVQISFAKSTLDFRKDEQRLQGVSNGKGGGVVGMDMTTTTATGKSTGIIVRGEGFSEDEIKSILGKLNGMAAKAGGDGMKGLAVLKPTTSKNGVTHLTLDLSVPVEGLSDGKAAATTAATTATTAATTAATGAASAATKPAGVNVTA